MPAVASSLTLLSHPIRNLSPREKNIRNVRVSVKARYLENVDEFIQSSVVTFFSPCLGCIPL